MDVKQIPVMQIMLLHLSSSSIVSTFPSCNLPPNEMVITGIFKSIPSPSPCLLFFALPCHVMSLSSTSTSSELLSIVSERDSPQSSSHPLYSTCAYPPWVSAFAVSYLQLDQNSVNLFTISRSPSILHLKTNNRLAPANCSSSSSTLQLQLEKSLLPPPPLAGNSKLAIQMNTAE